VNAEVSAGSETLLILHGMTFAIVAIGVMALQIAEAFRFSVLNVVLTGGWMLLGIPMMIFAARIWGSEGIAGARLAATLITIPVIIYSERRFLGSFQGRFWAAVGIRIAAAIALTVAVQELIFSIAGDSYLSLFAAGFGGGFIYLLTLLIAGFLTEEDKEVLRWAFFRKSPKVAETSD